MLTSISPFCQADFGVILSVLIISGQPCKLCIDAGECIRSSSEQGLYVEFSVIEETPALTIGIRSIGQILSVSEHSY
ncbi:hypothetical protein PFLuk1_02972 [Pseudomonas fluorescens]|nr:hypothetical protein PFLuk1_02972 [Pseudomonas fluorescens]